MHAHRFIAGLVVTGTLTACGSGAGSQGAGGESGTGGANACSFSVAPAAPAKAAASASHQDQATASAYATYDTTVGRFLRGEVAVYRGSMQATAKRGLNSLSGPDTADYSMASGEVIAALDVRDAWSGDFAPPQPTVSGKAAILVVQSPSQKKHVAFAQYDSKPKTTQATSVGEERQLVTLDTSCEGCLPNLFQKPASLPFHFTATGTASVFVGVVNQGGMQKNVSTSSDYTATLAHADPCTLTKDDLSTLNTTTGPNETGDFEFNASGDELVWHVSGSFAENASGKCAVYTPWSIDLVVQASDLGKVSVRSYSEGTGMMECGG